MWRVAPLSSFLSTCRPACLRVPLQGIESLFFDRESAAHKYLYHGRIEAFVQAVRETGVNI